MKYRKLFRYINGWYVTSFLAASVVLIPNIAIMYKGIKHQSPYWTHIKEYLLIDGVTNTILLLVLTGILASIVGTLSAWFVVRYEFPLRKFFDWALILPFAIPPYIGAYTYVNLVSYNGPVQKLIRMLGIEVNQRYFQIQNIYGAVFIYTVFLFPYVYMIVRSFIQKESGSLIEVSKTLGKSSSEIFFKVVLPLARGSIVAGVSLVLLEVLNDYGVVSYFGIQTLSTTIFSAWFGLNDIISAKKVATVLMIFVFTILLIERYSRKAKRVDYSTSKVRPIKREKLSKFKAALVLLFSFTIFSFGFLIPVIQMLLSSLSAFHLLLDYKFLTFVFNSLRVGVIATIVIALFSLVTANAVRISSNRVITVLREMVTFGYSVPGAVISIGILAVLFALDESILKGSASYLLSSTSIVLIVAYLIRFLAIGYNTIESGFQKIGKSFFEASRTLGHGTFSTFLKVDIPLIKPAIRSAVILVLIEILKELPLTLILRPFNFDTLGTKVYQYISDEMIANASLLSLILVGVCTLGVFYVTRNRKNIPSGGL
ncbi:ABC transporter permease [Fervidobacterium islandicum]|uniref:ABC transporter permease n=1 Tax=Fervidobacterium islandicum TaxID=2423 RepID=UPI003A64031A